MNGLITGRDFNMAWIEEREVTDVDGNLTTWYYVRPDKKSKPFAAGCGKEGKRLAENTVSKLNHEKYLSKCGMLPPEAKGVFCKDADMGSAIRAYQETILKIDAEHPRAAKNPDKPRIGERRGSYPTIKCNSNMFLKFIGQDKMVSTVTEDDLLEFKAKLRKDGRHTNYIISILKIVSAFFTYCGSEWSIRVNPVTEKVRDKLKEVLRAMFLGQVEITTLLKYCYIDDFANIIKLALASGMRQGEIVHVHKSWVNNHIINIPWEYTKSKKPRAVKIPRKYWDFLDSLVACSVGDRFFPGWSENRARVAWRRIIGRAMKFGGLKRKLRFHDLRHTFAKNFLQGGGTLGELQIILGHSSYATTEKYYKQYEDAHLQSQVDKISYDFGTAPALAII